MERAPGDDLVARVVAWHNRHPLARRIGPQHVQGFGLVALPFVLDGPAAAAAPEPGAGSLRERAARRAAGAGLPAAAAPATGKAQRGAFSERFLPPFSAAAVAQWALRHGTPESPGPADWPLRQVAVDGQRAAAASVGALWVRTAAVECGGAVRRVLIGAGGRPRVLGRRLWDLKRCTAVGALAGLLVGAAGWTLRAPHAPAAMAAAPAAPSGAASAASAAAAAEAAAAAAAASAMPAAPTGSAAPVRAAASAAPDSGVPALRVADEGSAPAPAEPPTATTSDPPQPAPAASAAASRLATAPPIVIAAGRPRTGRPPGLDDEAKSAARAEIDALRAARGLPPRPAPASAPAAPAQDAAPPEAPTPAAAAGARAVPSGATVWAVSTRALRTRFESEQMLVALRDAAARADAGQATRFEVMPAGDDFRAVNWPYARRADAERVRARLAERGLRVEVVEF
jgi:hypothetical protein